MFLFQKYEDLHLKIKKFFIDVSAQCYTNLCYSSECPAEWQLWNSGEVAERN